MLNPKIKSRRKTGFFHFHSLTFATAGILVLWIVLYSRSDPSRHVGAFYGNAIADWSGSVVIIIATKYLFERGSGESKPLHERVKNPLLKFLLYHSLSIFLILTGCGWAFLYAAMDSNSKWGQVVGNVLSEWVQMLGLVLLTKRLIERGSKESEH